MSDRISIDTLSVEEAADVIWDLMESHGLLGLILDRLNERRDALLDKVIAAIDRDIA